MCDVRHHISISSILILFDRDCDSKDNAVAYRVSNRCSYGVIATAIYLSELMDCGGFGDVLTIASREYFH